MRPSAKIGIGVALLLAAVALAAGRLDVLQGDRGPTALRSDPAPEFTGITRWLNGRPLTMAGLRGRVVLVDFWTYSCVNCVRTFDSLKALHERYSKAGLQIVGVHSPEFAFEKDPDRVRSAIQRHGLPYPVAMDNEMATWRAYRNNYWPHVYLVDTKGVIRFDHIGEGGEEEIERQVRALLAPITQTLPAPLSGPAGRTPPRGVTPEIYAGFDRGGRQGSLANPEGYEPHGVTDYRAVPLQEVERAGTEGAFFLEGPWRAEAEYVEATAPGSRVVLRFHARDVFIVAAAKDPARVTVLLDGEQVRVGAFRGQSAGEQLLVRAADLYRVVAKPEVQTHTLILEASPGFRLYTFTFG